MNSNASIATDSLSLMDIREAARRMSTTVFAIRELIRSNKLKFVSVGHKQLISPAAIADFISISERYYKAELPSRDSTIVERQYDIYVKQISTRERSPAKKSTLAQYHSYWRIWIHPFIGQMKVSQVRNGEMRQIVARMIAAKLSPHTIAGVVNCVKGIVASAIDAEGNQLFPIRWNTEFTAAPEVVNGPLKQAPERPF